MKSRGMTIVELIVVITIVGILAGIVIAGYGAWRTDIAKTSVKSDMMAATSKLKDHRNWGNSYPATGSLNSLFTPSTEVTLTYTLRPGGASYCLRGLSTAVSSVVFYYDSAIGGDPTTTVCS